MAILRYYWQVFLYRHWENYSYIYGITEMDEGRLEYLLELKRINGLLANIELTSVNQGK